MNTIVVVEDDQVLGESLQKLLVAEDYQVNWVSRISDLSAEVGRADLILLDWRLPDGQGVDALKNLRAKGIDVPVILLTAKSELIDKVVGLESWANDYITKPFEPRELVARIRAHLRICSGINNEVNGRASGEAEVKGKSFRRGEHSSNVLEFSQIRIHPEERAVYFLGKSIELTKLEYDLLHLLASSPYRVFSRDEILNKVWGYENYPTTRTVDTHILQLRQKTSEDCFETVRGVGYKFRASNIES